MTPAALIINLFFSGSTLLASSFGTGRSIFTAWVWTGMVMMNMMRSTSMTSINGVMFTSIIGSSSSRSLTAVDMGLFLQTGWTAPLEAAQRGRTRRRFRNEPDLLETGILHRVDHPADALVRRVDVAADMQDRKSTRLNSSH